MPCWAVICVVLFSISTSAQKLPLTPDLRFDNFTNIRNFTGNHINMVLRSKNGYVWAASNGLYRFDGKEYVRYSYFLNEEHKYTDFDISDLTEDAYGRIWLGCKSGLCYFDQAANKFYDVDTVKEHKITDVYGFCKTPNKLWFISENGVSYTDLQTLKVHSALNKHNRYNALHSLDSNTIICMQYGAYSIYNIKENSYKDVELGSGVKDAIYCVAKTNNKFWFGTSVGMLVTDDINKSPTLVKGSEVFGSFELKTFPEFTGDSILWIATITHGLVLFNANQGKIVYSYTHDPDNPYSISSDQVNDIFIDSTHLVWVATENGISLLNYSNQSMKELFFYKNKILNFSQDRFEPRYAWISTIQKGLIKMDWHTKKEMAHYYPFKANTGNDAAVTNVYQMSQIGGNKWLLSSRNALCLWNTKSGIATPVKFSFPDASLISGIIPYNHDSFLIVRMKGLYVYSVRANKADTIFLFKKPAFIYGGIYDKEDGLWFATRDGLLNYNISTRESHMYRESAPDDRDKRGVSLALDKKGKKIIRATRTGVSVFDLVSKKFSFFDQFDDVKKPICSYVTVKGRTAWIIFAGGILSLNLDNNEAHIAVSSEHFHSSGPAYGNIGDELFVSMTDMFSYFNTKGITRAPLPSTPILEIFVAGNRKFYFPDKPVSLTHKENIISFRFTAFDFNDPDHIQFRYKLAGLDSAWTYAGDKRDVNYIQLPNGKYVLILQAGNGKGFWNENATSYSFEIVPAYWQTLWFRILLLAGFIAMVIGIATMRIRNIKRREAEKTKVNVAIAEMELKALRSQMNPHFIFNSLNSIQKFIWENKQEDAAEYLTKFSRLIRMILDNSMHKWITLEQEISALSLYIELEHRRCNNKFDYVINVDNNVDTAAILLPPLILQPFVENAIWHGLLNKEERGELKIIITKEEQDIIRYVIEDNGVGRSAARVIKENREAKYTSHGIQLTNQRLAMINENGKKGMAKIEDIYDANGAAAGTRVVIHIPISTFVKT